MSKTETDIKNTTKTPKRNGRPLGARNKRTVWREEAAKRAIVAARAHLTDEEIDAMDALAVMRLVMSASVKAGDMVAALAAARDLAPFEHPKKMAEAPAYSLPMELMPDPPTCPDEPGPPGGSIDVKMGFSDPPGCPIEPGPKNPIW